MKIFGILDRKIVHNNLLQKNSITHHVLMMPRWCYMVWNIPKHVEMCEETCQNTFKKHNETCYLKHVQTQRKTW